MATILKTKLFIPPYSTQNLPRKRLLEKIDLGVEKKLTLITAPAGFGKTTLALEWINQRSAPTAWYTIDSNDNGFETFFSYFVAALKTTHEQIEDLFITFNQPVEKLDYQDFVIPIINNVSEIDDDIVLVLDDYHTLTELEITRSLCYLFEHCSSNLHLIVISRTIPDFQHRRTRPRLPRERRLKACLQSAS